MKHNTKSESDNNVEDASIQPDDPAPQRENEDFGRMFTDALSTMDQYMASEDPYVSSLGKVNDPVELDLRVHPEWSTRLMAFLKSFNPKSPLGPEAIWLMDNQFSMRTGR